VVVVAAEMAAQVLPMAGVRSIRAPAGPNPARSYSEIDPSVGLSTTRARPWHPLVDGQVHHADRAAAIFGYPHDPAWQLPREPGGQVLVEVRVGNVPVLFPGPLAAQLGDRRQIGWFGPAN
jgi:hypothetical protein